VRVRLTRSGLRSEAMCFLCGGSLGDACTTIFYQGKSVLVCVFCESDRWEAE